MSLHVFESFVKMIARLPAEAIPGALDLQCKMLKDDLEHSRLSVPEDAFSILCFRQFVRMAEAGEAMQCIKPLPPDHIEFYKETVVRLVQAKELPQSAMDQFDYAFARSM